MVFRQKLLGSIIQDRENETALWGQKKFRRPRIQASLILLLYCASEGRTNHLCVTHKLPFHTLNTTPCQWNGSKCHLSACFVFSGILQVDFFLFVFLSAVDAVGQLSCLQCRSVSNWNIPLAKQRNDLETTDCSLFYLFISGFFVLLFSHTNCV